METMLWVVVIVASVLAIGLALFAWRLLRRDHHRTGARAALLRQLAFEPDAPLAPDPPAHDVLRAAPVTTWEPAVHTRAPSRGWIPALVALLCLALGAWTVYGLYRPDAVEARAQTLPLDLFSLSHRLEAGALVVTGLIQNPREGQPVPRVMAVAYVFNAQGEYTASGKAALEFAPLAPGAQSPFVIRIPAVEGVTRFRVGFRAEDGSVIAHVDRRGQPIDGTTAGTPLGAEGR
ncbi:MAG: hypothetical protein NUW22_15710 [Acidobacteria bacterium]|nr:hypothetical protein [Acidobacteriota bacterium]